MDKMQKFKNALYIVEKQGWEKLIVFAHAHLETTGFKDMPNFNAWGIKFKPKYWNAQNKDILKTFEIVSGKKVDIKDEFMVFGSEFQAMTFYCFWIEHCYPEAYINRKDYKKYYKGLMNCVWSTPQKRIGWSTSPTYSDDLIRLYERLEESAWENQIGYL